MKRSPFSSQTPPSYHVARKREILVPGIKHQSSINIQIKQGIWIKETSEATQKLLISVRKNFPYIFQLQNTSFYSRRFGCVLIAAMLSDLDLPLSNDLSSRPDILQLLAWEKSSERLSGVLISLSVLAFSGSFSFIFYHQLWLCVLDLRLRTSRLPHLDYELFARSSVHLKWGLCGRFLIYRKSDLEDMKLRDPWFGSSHRNFRYRSPPLPPLFVSLLCYSEDNICISVLFSGNLEMLKTFAFGVFRLMKESVRLVFEPWNCKHSKLIQDLRRSEALLLQLFHNISWVFFS